MKEDNHIKNNLLNNLPPQELIDSNSNIALSLWHDSALEDNYLYSTFVSFYHKTNWKEILHNYNNDMDFWKKAINHPKFGAYAILSNPDFQKDFKDVFDSIIKDKSMMLDLIENSHGSYLYFYILDETIFNKEELDSLYKREILKFAAHFQYTKIAGYQDDEVFVKELLIKDPIYYALLNEENREKDEYIKLALKHKTNINIIPKSKVDNYIDTWLQVHQENNFSYKDIENLSSKQKGALLEARIDLIPICLSKNFSDYKNLAIQSLQNNLEEKIGYFSNAQIMNLFKEKESVEKITSQLQDFAQKYNKTKAFSKNDNKIIGLISLDKIAEQTLENNIFYQLNNMQPHQKITNEKFEDYFKKINSKVKTEEINLSKANLFLNKLKNKLSITALQEKPYPKDNLYEYLENSLSKPKLKM